MNGLKTNYVEIKYLCLNGTIEVPKKQHALFSLVIQKPTKELKKLLAGITEIEITEIEADLNNFETDLQQFYIKKSLKSFFVQKDNSNFSYSFNGSNIFIKDQNKTLLAVINISQSIEQHHSLIVKNLAS